jgi:hypothetical protein
MWTLPLSKIATLTLAMLLKLVSGASMTEDLVAEFVLVGTLSFSKTHLK